MTRRKGIRWDYNCDGLYAREHLSAFWKRYWRRWVRRCFKDWRSA